MYFWNLNYNAADLVENLSGVFMNNNSIIFKWSWKAKPMSYEKRKKTITKRDQSKKKIINSDYNNYLVITYKIGIVCDDDVTLPIRANLIVLP